MPLASGSRLGPYEILGALGAGGMGEVYRARDAKLGRDVAIKVLPELFASDAERLARFQREAQVLASLNHSNIAQIYGFEDSSGVHALVMELVEGPTLGEMIAGSALSASGFGPVAMPEAQSLKPKASTLPLSDALNIARQLAEALEAAHEQGIIHRDLKPANIKVRPDGTVKVLDFGLAKLAEAAGAGGAGISGGSALLSHSPTITSPAMMTQAGVILGTAAYMSPEQARGRPADRRSDIWAFGCVLFEMLTGTRAFPGDDFAETFASVVKAEPDWSALPPDTPTAIRRLLRRCLQKDPKRRLQTAGDARLEIDDAVTEPDQRTTAPAAPVAAPKSGARELVAWAVAALALLGGASVAWLHLRETPPVQQPLHLSIALPEDGDVRSLALSPDGRSVVMAAQIDNKYQLWIRRLDEPEFRPLAGTNLARVPFWSPDSRSIGFFADGRLKTVSATGGPTRALCDAGTSGGGGTWNRDGTILYARDLPGPIYQVSASGADCKPLTQPAPDSAHRFPEFLPDGHHFFYVVGRGDEALRGVYVASLDDPNGKRVLADQSSVNYVPPSDGQGPGRLIFLRGDTLMAQAFDATTLQIVGDPVVIASHASASNTAPQMAASAAAIGALVFVSNGENSQGRQLSWFDRAGKELEKAGTVDRYTGIAPSPDGKTAALSIREADGVATSLWLRDLVRQTVSRFSPPGGSSNAPVWSPDGKRIVFSGVRPGSPAADLLWKDVGNADEHVLLKNPVGKYASDWSRDGRYLVYTQVEAKTGADIWVLPNPAAPSATDQKPFAFANTAFMESEGQISPDGHSIAYVSDESGPYEVYVRPFPSGDGKWRVSSAGGRDPRWRSDGKEIFYQEGVIGKLRIMAVSVTPVASTSVAPSFGTPTQLFEFRTAGILPPFNSFAYSPSLDGQRFLLQHMANDIQATLDVLLNWQGKIER